MDKPPIVVNVFRYWPGADNEARYVHYLVPFEKGMTVFGALRFIYRTLDRTLAFRDFQCGRGICGTCRLKVNGQTVKACNRLVHNGDSITIEPLHPIRVIRDLASR